MTYLKILFILAITPIGAALATTFDYSYQFQDGLVVTGRLDGTRNGVFVEDVTNVSMSFLGFEAGKVFTAFLDGTTFRSGAIVSFHASLNNFAFSDNDLANGDLNSANYFYMFGGFVSPSMSAYAYANWLPPFSWYDYPINESTWSLTAAPATSSVPDTGATLGLLGFALLGAAGIKCWPRLVAP